MNNYFFTADEHYFHNNILKYSSRPFNNIDDMNHSLIMNNNKIVTDNDYVIHVGDFTLANRDAAESIIKQLKGKHIFVIGSHDKWLNGKGSHIWERKIEGQHIVCVHYAMYSWPRSHYGSWLCYGHHHGSFSIPCKAIDVGVDTNNFYPYSFQQLKDKMETKPITPGTIVKNIKIGSGSDICGR
jgi:calcineurin-like phosphoesterase family protein